jgi:hypothetical protein
LFVSSNPLAQQSFEDAALLTRTRLLDGSFLSLFHKAGRFSRGNQEAGSGSGSEKIKI